MRFIHALLLLIICGGLFVLLGYAGMDFSRGCVSWRADLTFLFLFGVWAGFVLLTKGAEWMPRCRRWFHSLTFILLCCVGFVVLSHPDRLHLLIMGTVTAVAGYFGENWVEYLS